MNKCFFTGRLVRDIEIRYTQGAEPLAVGRTSIAVETGFGDSKKTHFFNVSVFGKRAEVMEKYVKKGHKVTLECEATQNEYKDRNGNDIRTVSFIIKDFEFGENKSSANKTNESAGGFQSQPKQQSMDGFYPVDNSADDDDLPF